MPILQTRYEQLAQILSAWNSLDDETKKRSINLVMYVVEGASLVNEIAGTKYGAELNEQLAAFREGYEKILGADISKLGGSDFSQPTMALLNLIDAIDKTDKPLEEKRAEVAHMLAAKGFRDLKSFREVLIKESDHKYQHANARISWNYGKLVDSVVRTKSPLAARFAKFAELENEEQFFKALLELNKEAQLANNFDAIKHAFGLDGLEEHTCVNQGTLYRLGLDRFDVIDKMMQHKGGPAAYLAEQSQLKSIKVDTKTMRKEVGVESQHAEAMEQYKSAVAEKLKVTLGFEMEFLLLPVGGPEAERNRDAKRTEFEKVVRGVADLDSRIKMRMKYGFPHKELAHTTNALLLFSKEELAETKEVTSANQPEKRAQIKHFLAQNIPAAEHELYDQAIANIDLLSPEEIYFMDLMFLQNAAAVEHRLTLDNVFEWDKDLATNLKNIVPMIAQRGGFYLNTLDMIRANEVAIGPFNFENASAQKDAAVQFMRGVAQKHNMRLKDRDIQLNVGVASEHGNLKIIAADDEAHPDAKKPMVDEYTKSVLQAIQRAVATTLAENPWVSRFGQEAVSVGVDRKKGCNDVFINTPYFTSYDPQKHKENGSAFPVHRDNTGKAGMVRLARINEDLAVVEIRLIGNNTHVPDHDEAVKIVFNGMDLLGEMLMVNLEHELQELELKRENGQVAVSTAGLVDGVAPLGIDYSRAASAALEFPSGRGSAATPAQSPTKATPYKVASAAAAVRIG